MEDVVAVFKIFTQGTHVVPKGVALLKVDNGGETVSGILLEEDPNVERNCISPQCFSKADPRPGK